MSSTSCHLSNVSSSILYARKFFFILKTLKCNFLKSKAKSDSKVKQRWWRMSFCGAGGRMYFLMLLKWDMSKLIMLRKLQRQPVQVHSTHSPHAKRRRPVKQHLRQLKDIKQSKNDQNRLKWMLYGIWSRIEPLDTLLKFMRSQLSIYFVSVVSQITNE